MQRTPALLLLGVLLLGTSAACNKSDEDEGAASSKCGKKGLPDCPLQSWMKTNLKSALDQSNAAKLAPALDDLAQHAPAGYDDWEKTAKLGADAARGGNLSEVKAQCKVCHDQHRSKYRKEMRETRLF